MPEDRQHPRMTDNAFRATSLKGGVSEPTYGGALSFMRRKFSRDLAGVDAVIWGVPFDAATSNRAGSRFGPQAIRRASAIFDGDPQYPFHADPYETLATIDWGDCSFDYGRHHEIPACIETQAGEIIAQGAHLVTLGGDHFVTLPILRAMAKRHGKLALVQFDAHQDTWYADEDRIDHGSFVGRAVAEGLIDPARSIQIGIRTHAPEDCGIKILYGDDVHDMGEAEVARAIVERVSAGPAYLTFDIDCLDPAFAPGTGTPVSGGLSSAQALRIMRKIGGLDFVGMDIMEVAPPYDHADITAIAASTVALYHIANLAARRAGR